MADDNETIISDELLESIAGGVLDDASKYNIDALVGAFKKQGLSLDQVYERFSFVKHDDSAADIFAYIDEVYARPI